MLNQKLGQIAAAYRAGNLQHAKAQAEALYHTHPYDAAVLGLLGMLCAQTGHLRRGARYLREALQRDPANPANRINLARALIDLGDLDAAAQVCDADTTSNPDLLRLSADIAKAHGRAAEAAAAYEQAVRERPDDFEAWNNLGNSRHQFGDIAGAVVALGRARDLKPASATVRLNLGRALASAARYEESLAELKEASRLDPGNAEMLTELGRALTRLGRSAEAIPLLADAARIDRTEPAIYEAIGLAFAGEGEFKRAEEAHRIAIHVAAGHAPSYFSLGILLEQANRLEELEALLGQAVANGVAGGELAYLRALMLRREGKLVEAYEQLRAAPADAVDEIVKQQLTGQLADRLGHVDEAFDAFRHMNEAAARHPLAVNFDGTEHQQYVEQLQRLTTGPWIASWPKADLPADPPAPAFLVGFPRSGTTLLDTVLMGHPGTHVLEEEPVMERVTNAMGGMARIAELGEAEVQALRQRYFEELQAISPAPPGALVIDKLPLNLLRAPTIHRIFPDARFILALRHPCDCVLSCYMQNFRINRAMASFLDLGNAVRLYDRAFAYWEQCRNLLPLKVHTVRYEAMVTDLAGEIGPLLDYLGLEWDKKVLDYQRTAGKREMIRTPSYAQVTEKLYTRASGRWERYREHMRDVLPILAPWAERYGYPNVFAEGTAAEA